VSLDAIAEVIYAAKQAQQNAKDWSESAKHLREQIKALMLTKNIRVGTVNGEPAVSVQHPKPKRTFRHKDFARDYPELYEQYCDEEPSTPRLVFE
jgi:dihydrodipicolinate reductase